MTLPIAADPAPPPPAGHPAPEAPVLAMFPGQGSQRPGMARHLVSEYPDIACPVLDEAGKALGLPLGELCVSGSAEQLARTEITQPAVVATSLATLEVLRRAGGFAPTAVAGHSLGEYAALVAAGVLSRVDALRLVARRGRLMARIGSRVRGGMTAITGLSSARVEEICRRAGGHGVVEVANYNEDGQTVVSGGLTAVAEAARLAREAGAERTVPLRVSAPFHCSLMLQIEAEFAAALERCHFADPRVPLLSSVTGGWVRSGEDARTLLRRQLAGPVRWVEVLRTAHARPDVGVPGIGSFVEVGPGRVLSGFGSRIIPGSRVRSTNDSRRVAALLRDPAGPPPHA
jgi:[acyl-carrier-protein] S-malonyltransferase